MLLPSKVKSIKPVNKMKKKTYPFTDIKHIFILELIYTYIPVNHLYNCLFNFSCMYDTMVYTPSLCCHLIYYSDCNRLGLKSEVIVQTYCMHIVLLFCLQLDRPVTRGKKATVTLLNVSPKLQCGILGSRSETKGSCSERQCEGVRNIKRSKPRIMDGKGLPCEKSQYRIPPLGQPVGIWWGRTHVQWVTQLAHSRFRVCY